MASWGGQCSRLLDIIVDKIKEEIFNSSHIHGDDTTLKVLTPGAGKTKTARLWVYSRNGINHDSNIPPAICYFYSPDRKGIRPQSHLESFKGILHADAYSGYDKLYKENEITESACWAHTRRKFYEVTVANDKANIANEILIRIGEIHKIEQRIIDLKNSIDMLYQEEQLNQGGAEEELQLELQLKQQTAMTEVRQLSLIKRAIKKGGDPLKVVENIKENLEKKLTNHDELKKCKTQEDISVTNMVLQWIKEGREEGRDDLGQNDLDKKPPSKKPEPGKPPRPTEPEGAFYRRVKCLIKMFQGDAGPTESPQHPRVQQDAKISRVR
tara:strand:+ start:443 stop:1420 length:978 start_codon:yes stop_codon:yes gene_type:complete